MMMMHSIVVHDDKHGLIIDDMIMSTIDVGYDMIVCVYQYYYSMYWRCINQSSLQVLEESTAFLEGEFKRRGLIMTEEGGWMVVDDDEVNDGDGSDDNDLFIPCIMSIWFSIVYSYVDSTYTTIIIHNNNNNDYYYYYLQHLQSITYSIYSISHQPSSPIHHSFSSYSSITAIKKLKEDSLRDLNDLDAVPKTSWVPQNFVNGDWKMQPMLMD